MNEPDFKSAVATANTRYEADLLRAQQRRDLAIQTAQARFFPPDHTAAPRSADESVHRGVRNPGTMNNRVAVFMLAAPRSATEIALGLQITENYTRTALHRLRTGGVIEAHTVPGTNTKVYQLTESGRVAAAAGAQ